MKILQLAVVAFDQLTGSKVKHLAVQKSAAIYVVVILVDHYRSTCIFEPVQHIPVAQAIDGKLQI